LTHTLSLSGKEEEEERGTGEETENYVLLALLGNKWFGERECKDNIKGNKGNR
jgi:hypothetical protein